MKPLTPREKRRCVALWMTLVKSPFHPPRWPTFAMVAAALTCDEFKVSEQEVEDAVRWCLNRPRPKTKRRRT